MMLGDRKITAGDRTAPLVQEDSWTLLKRYTDARIALGRCGVSLPHQELLDFRLAHAKARDAVYTPLDRAALEKTLKSAGFSCFAIKSAAENREEYLRRPDKGRRLSDQSRAALAETADLSLRDGCDICVVISDGLSAHAVHENAAPLVIDFLTQVQRQGLRASPVLLAEFGRVAIADEAAAILGATLVVNLIGERPGLSASNSMGAYVTYNPFPGCTDEARNCISNIRGGGLSIEEGVRKLCYVVQCAFAGKETGVNLKDNMPQDYLPFSHIQSLPLSRS